MPESEIETLIQCLKELSSELSPKLSLEQTILYLLVCTKEEYPLTELGEELDWNTLKTSRQVNTLASDRYNGKDYYDGYEVLYTQEDPESRIFKNAFLTHKGRELKEKVIGILKKNTTKKSKKH